jgi:predicted enzyme related to lactoylglutathione lyase
MLAGQTTQFNSCLSDPAMNLVKIRLITRDVPALSRFYASMCGIPAYGSDEYVELRTPMGTVAITSQRAMGLYGVGSADPSARRSMVLGFEVADVDATRRRLAGVVTSFILEPTTQPWGNRSMLFRDPDGNLINVFSVTDVYR